MNFVERQTPITSISHWGAAVIAIMGWAMLATNLYGEEFEWASVVNSPVSSLVVNSPVVSVPGPVYQNSPTTYVTPTNAYPVRHASTRSSSRHSVQPGFAQSKAARAAQQQLRAHLGGGLGGAKYEGVGWSNQSAQSAIEHCCYWGQRPVAQIGVAKGADGFWYACVLYH